MEGRKFFGVERPLQVIAAAILSLSFALGSPTGWGVTIYLFFYGNLWVKVLMTAYLIYIYRNKDPCFEGAWSKKAVDRFRNLKLWRHSCNYFPIKIVKTAKLDPSKNYLLCYFPHGLLASGACGGIATNGADVEKVFPGFDFHLATLNQHFVTPFYREYLHLLGSRSCDARSLEHLLSTKSKNNRSRAVLVAIGGIAEAFKSRPGNHEILLKKRKGFVKVALKTGAPLVPVFSFGETDLFGQVDNPKGSLLRKVQDLCKKHTGFAPIIPIGRGFLQKSFGLIPRRKPIFVVVGAPIILPKVEKLTREYVDKYHAKFTECLIDLFETHKSKYIKNHESVSLVLADE